MPRSGTTVTRFLLDARSGDASVWSAIADLWATILTVMGKMRWVKNSSAFVVQVRLSTIALGISIDTRIIGEHVVFSSRCQLLVSKFGRSSKPSPRYLIMVSAILFTRRTTSNHFLQTAKTIYILVTTAKEGHVSTVVERQIGLSSVKSIAMSSMRDDWLVSITAESSSTLV